MRHERKNKTRLPRVHFTPNKNLHSSAENELPGPTWSTQRENSHDSAKSVLVSVFKLQLGIVVSNFILLSCPLPPCHLDSVGLSSCCRLLSRLQPFYIFFDMSRLLPQMQAFPGSVVRKFVVLAHAVIDTVFHRHRMDACQCTAGFEYLVFEVVPIGQTRTVQLPMLFQGTFIKLTQHDPHLRAD